MATTNWSDWDQLKYRRRLETFGLDDGPSMSGILLQKSNVDVF